MVKKDGARPKSAVTDNPAEPGYLEHFFSTEEDDSGISFGDASFAPEAVNKD